MHCVGRKASPGVPFLPPIQHRDLQNLRCPEPLEELLQIGRPDHSNMLFPEEGHRALRSRPGKNNSLTHLVLGCQTIRLKFGVVVVQFIEYIGGLDLVLTTHYSPNTSDTQILRFDGNKYIWTSIKVAPVVCH